MGSAFSRSNRLVWHTWARAGWLVAACVSLQCTYDFERFDPVAADAQGGAGGATIPLSDASAGGSTVSDDQSSAAPDSAGGQSVADATLPDVQGPFDAAAEALSDAGCSSGCIGTAKTCAATCNSTSDKCVADCNRANCRTMCMTARTTCLIGCVNKCETCTRDAACQQSAQCTATAQ